MRTALPTRPLRRAAIASGFRLMGGASRFTPPSWRGSGAILALHHVRPPQGDSFAPNGNLEITPDFLRVMIRTVREAGFDIVSLDDAVARLAGATPSRRPFAVVTLDDGYRDNAVYAAPIFREAAVPYTLFITTDFADGRGRLWWDELEAAIRVLPAINTRIDGRPIVLPATTAAEKQAAFEAIYWRLRGGSEADLLSGVAALAADAGLDPAALTRASCLGWDELAALADDPLCTIGAHTVSHPRLAKLDEEAARREMADSRRRIEARLGRPVRHLAFPVGDPTSAGAREFGLAQALGFASAVTMRPGMVFPAHAGHLHALPRLSVNGGWQSRAALTTLLSGAPFWVWNRGRALNIA